MTVPTGPTLPRWSYLGASDVAAIVGLHPYRTALDVWGEKVHRVQVPDNSAMHVGRNLERPVLETLYAEPRRLNLEFPGTLRNPSEPWMGATPDALAGPQPPEGAEKAGWIVDRAAECKIVGRYQMRRWGDPEEGVDGIPPEVLVQVTWQLATLHAVQTPLEVADVTALLGTELRVYRVAYDAEFASDLLEATRAWWKHHVEAGEMPEVTAESRETLDRIYRRPILGMLEMREDVRDLCQAYLSARRDEKIATHSKAFFGAELCARIGDATGFEGGGFKATWQNEKGRISYKAIVEDLEIPDAEREEYRGEPIRKLRVTGPEGDEE